MAPFLLLLFLLSEAASDLIEVPVHHGDDVILPCRTADPSISVVKWTRPDLVPDIVVYYSDGHLTPEEQNPSFKDRVELVDRYLKDGDTSLILKNVRSIDAGTYECRVKTNDTEPIRLISTVRLQVPDLPVVVRPGDDVILPCQSADPSIRAVKWSRADLKHPEYVLLNIDGQLNTTHQNPSFKGRVELVYRKLKNGDVSLILKNVNINDNGTYECRFASGGLRRKKRSNIDSEPIRIIHLQVRDSGYKDGNSSPVGQYFGLAAVSVAAGVVLLAAVVGVLIYRRHKNKRSGQPAAADNEASADKFINNSQSS
ncbi:tyrosine-protein kinase-like otk [Perca flavescens]|uniref:tyrosine-protein kinase-like otk n=1 Tax=Perca flavescens TaxID=8167 RepID=UPI00106E142F|nr:tyrosine-protein kinase-like otk [Perca flavescens]